MPYTSARRTQRNHDRQERVNSGAPSFRHDWRCHLCKRWISNYRGRNLIHLRTCQEKAAQRIAREKKRRDRVALTPPPDYFTPHSTPDQIDTEGSPRGVERETRHHDADDFEDHGDGLEYLENEVLGPPPAPGGMQLEDDENPTQMGTDLEARTPTQGSNTLDPATWPLELGETLVVYHPHSNLAPQVVRTTELAGSSRQPENHGGQVLLNDSRPPYFPFKTLADFEQTELFVKRDYPDPQINEQLEIWERHATGSTLTLKNAREMHQHLLDAGNEEDLSQFEKVEIQVPYTHKKTVEKRKYKVRFRPVLDAVKHVLEDPALRKHLIRYPERHYIRKPGTNENMRVWSDVHTADDWWEIQDKLEPGRIAVNVSLYCDGTQLNSFGTKKACGVYLWINNFPNRIRWSRSKKGGAILVGYIPEVRGKSSDNSSALANHRAQVYQTAYFQILRSAIGAARQRQGFTFNDGSISPCSAVFNILLAILDYEEATRATTTLGANSGFPCPICLIPSDNLWDLSEVIYPRRKRDGALRLIARAQVATSKKAAKKILNAQSIRNVDNTFLNYFSQFTSIYEAISADLLHQIELGVHGKHIWPWIVSKGDMIGYLSGDDLDELDNNFKRLPPMPGVHHFANGVTKIKYLTARELNTILRYLPPLLVGIRGTHDIDAIVIPTLRELACTLLLGRFRVHTSDTLGLLRQHIDKFGEYSKRLRSLEDFLGDNRISFSWPKMHSITHLIESIKGKGVAANSSTDGGEALHPQTRVHWARCNHQPDSAEDQMLRMQYEKEVVLSIRHRIEVWEQEQLFNTNIADVDYVEAISERPRICLGSRQRGIKISSYEQVLDEEIGFSGFGDSLASFLRDHAHVEVHGSNFEGDGFEGHQRCIYWYKVFPHHSCKIAFDCQETAARKTEIFHVTPTWRGSGPRYDSVIIQGSTPSSLIFAQVCAMFNIYLAEQTFRIIVARTYKKKGRNKVTGYIELNRPADGCFSLYFAESIIRSVHILPPVDSSSNYVVQDLYDGDMYLRLIRTK